MGTATRSVIKNEAGVLAKLEQAKAELAECRTLPEVKKIRDVAEDGQSPEKELLTFIYHAQ